MALVAASDAPILLLNDDLTVLAASASFSRAFQIDPEGIGGVSLFALAAGEWDLPQLRFLLKATLSSAARVDAYEMELKQPGRAPRQLVITAHPLAYGDLGDIRVLLTVSDVTDARGAERLKDDLLRDKAILFQELQHRVANSLQIIASLLMRSARQVSSTETRGYLRDAHSRLMSVAALQKQLSVSSMDDVDLRTYLQELCGSIGSSMIHEADRIQLSVEADDATAAASVAVSLGLIVTELAINALKHAFPDSRSGRILVSYQSHEAGWTLSVSDDGVGMPGGAALAKAGLGTSIVEALAMQLDAEVSHASANPGARVCVTHKAAPAGT